MKQIFRPILKKVLVLLTKLTLNKHNPQIICVLGTGHTSIARETIYSGLKSEIPARRNIEAPEAEFSTPLAVFGELTYPKSYVSWCKTILLTLLRLFFVKKYYHFLILELTSVNRETLNLWLKTLNPKVLVISGNSIVDINDFKFGKILKCSNEDTDIFEPYKFITIQIANYFGLDKEKVQKNLENLNLPKSKIRFLKGINNSTIIDATHYYTPVKLEAALEMIDFTENGRKVFFSSDEKELSLAKEKGFDTNPSNFSPENGDQILIRGERVKMNMQFRKYINLNIPLI